MIVAELDHIGVHVPGRAILDDLSLTVESGEFIALIGPNGAGKSTLLRVMAGVLGCTGGVSLGGQPIGALAARQRARRVSYLTQGGAIHWGLTVHDIVALGRLPFTGGGRLAAADAAIVARVIDDCGLGDIGGRPADALSGGERARVLFARALAVEAPLLLVDEPVASLDPAHQIGVMKMLRGQTTQGRAVVAVLHDLGLALRYATRIVALDRGRIVAGGTPAEIVAGGVLDRLYGLRFVHACQDGVAMTGAHEPSPAMHN